MERILKVQESLSNFDNSKTINLYVVNENGEDLQGRITIEKIDKVEFEPIETPCKCDCCEETRTPQYFVYNPMHEGKPQKIYSTYEAALHDAKDIANRYDEIDVYVLEIKTKIHKEFFVRESVTEDGKIIDKKEYNKIPF